MEGEPTLIVTVLRDFGLPVAMLLWFALRMERFVQNNTDALEELRLVVAAHMEAQARLARQGRKE